MIWFIAVSLIIVVITFSCVSAATELDRKDSDAAQEKFIKEYVRNK